MESEIQPSPTPRRLTRDRNFRLDTSNPLAELFGSRARAEVFRILFGLSLREFYISEMCKQTHMAEQGMDEQLRVLSALGLITSRRDGNRRYYRANTVHPFFPELHNMVLKSVGLKDVVARALTHPKVKIAFVFGSIARRQESPGSDVDIMVMGDVGLRELGTKLRYMSEELGREVNTFTFTQSEGIERMARRDPFFIRVMEAPKIFVIGDEHGLQTYLKFRLELRDQVK